MPVPSTAARSDGNNTSPTRAAYRFAAFARRSGFVQLCRNPSLKAAMRSARFVGSSQAPEPGVGLRFRWGAGSGLGRAGRGAFGGRGSTGSSSSAHFDECRRAAGSAGSEKARTASKIEGRAFTS